MDGARFSSRSSGRPPLFALLPRPAPLLNWRFDAPRTRLPPRTIRDHGPPRLGGVGEVYRAKDARLGRTVAVKVLAEAISRDPDARARFEREVRAVAAISHPNILAIHDLGREGEMDYAVMELLDGETLRQRLEHGHIRLNGMRPGSCGKWLA